LEHEYHLHSNAPWVHIGSPPSTGTAAISLPETFKSQERLFSIEALEHPLMQGKPDVFNTDQVSQFTSNAFTGILLG